MQEDMTYLELVDINTTKKSANLNSIIEELRKQNNMEFFIEDGFLKYFDYIRSTRNSLVHDTQITKKKEIIKIEKTQFRNFGRLGKLKYY